AESLRDASVAKNPPNSRLHVWWARRPLTASRAAVVASLLPGWPDDDEVAADPDAAAARKGLEAEFPGGEDEYRRWFVRSMGILGDPVAAKFAIKAAVAAGGKTEGNAYGYDRAFTVTPDTATVDRVCRLAALRAAVEDAPSVLDPFAGGGSIPFEAARFGCAPFANELNPVAVAILHGTVALPAELGPEFAAVIKRWGTTWAERVRQRLAPYFPHVEPDERLAYVWAHTVPCPSTGRATPLAPDFWLARGKAGRDVAVRIEADHEKIGVLRDHRGDGVAFQGSVNESATAWSANFESFSVYRSWDSSAGYYDGTARRRRPHGPRALPRPSRHRPGPGRPDPGVAFGGTGRGDNASVRDRHPPRKLRPTRRGRQPIPGLPLRGLHRVAHGAPRQAAGRFDWPLRPSRRGRREVRRAMSMPTS
ncbi:MAG: DUF1156 domain-containing protein, partial [Acidimicrobiales bacterium]